MNLFAYGTLMDPEIMAQVSGPINPSQKATLHQFVRKKLHGEVYPAITMRQGSSVDGVVYFNLSAAAFERLDRFEGYLYVRTETTVVCDDDKHVQTQAYVIRASYAHHLSGADWSYEKFLSKDKRFFQGGYFGYDNLA